MKQMLLRVTGDRQLTVSTEPLEVFSGLHTKLYAVVMESFKTLKVG